MEHEHRSAPDRTDDGLDAEDVGPGLPELPDGRMPPAESRSRQLLIRTAAIIALMVSAGYLTWRALFTIDLSVWFVAVPMLLLELHHAGGLALYTFSLWDVNAPPPPAVVDHTDARVALLIPTYDESIEVLLPVIAAAVAIEPAHETWVLDDGNRPEVERLARGMGASYLARSENTHAKAGNLNNALAELTDVDFIAVVDADHVVLPDFLRHTLGYFSDSAVAVVQTPQDFYNVDSFEHEHRPNRKLDFSEQSVFYRIILPAKNHWNAAFWCGTGAVVRVAALRSVGGVATETITEDIHTSIRMQKRGWKIVAHNEVLARGLASADANQYMLQRERWARGAMQVMRSEQLLTSRRLTLAQRVSYSATLWAWFDALRSMLFIVLPIAVLATGALPINAPLRVFGPLFLGSFLIQYTTLRLLARGHYPPWLSLVFETLRMPAVIPALGEVIRRSKARFKVTPKGRTDAGRRTVRPPLLLVGLFLASVAGLLWGAITIGGLTPLTYGNPGAMVGTSVFLVVNMALIIAATRRIIDPRFSGERRVSVRFPVDMAVRVDGHPARVEDVSLTGAQIFVRSDGAELGGTWTGGRLVDLDLYHQGLHLTGTAVRVQSRGDVGVELGVEFANGQWPAVRDLAVTLFHGNPDRKLTGDGAAWREAV